MKLHKRYQLCSEAGLALSGLLLKWLEKYDLTELEVIRMLNQEQEKWVRYALRSERHPEDPSRKADEE